jgi:hypothetical protein
MAIFDQVQRDQLGTTYTHYGWFCGLCPVYIGNPQSEAPTLAERNWIPSWWLDFTQWLFGCFIFINTVIDDDYEPLWPIKISGEIK